MQVPRHNRRTLLAAMMMAWITTGAVEAADSAFSLHTKAVYNAVCSVCHGDDGTGKTVGDNRFPAVAGLQKWYIEDQLLKFKHDGRGADARDKEGLMMHALVRTLRTDEEIEKMASYIASQLKDTAPALETVKGNVENGRKIYTAQGVMGCIRCHGDKFQGRDEEDADQLIPRAPSLTSQEDWYMLLQLEKFRSGVRGAPARTLIGKNLEQRRKDFARRQKREEKLNGAALMQAMSQTAFATQKDQEQAMKDVVAYIYSESRKSK